MAVFQRERGQSVHGRSIAKIESRKHFLADMMNRLQESFTKSDSICKRRDKPDLKNDDIDEPLVSLEQDYNRWLEDVFSRIFGNTRL
jgi:hypothetical protein